MDKWKWSPDNRYFATPFSAKQNLEFWKPINVDGAV